jgi:hypothetical protein
MQIRVRTPRPPLSGFVEVLWSFEGTAPSHQLERLLPDGSVELVINLREDRTRVYDRQDQRLVEALDRGCGSAKPGPASAPQPSGRSSSVGVR